MNRTTQKHLASLERCVAMLRPPSAALDGAAELRRLGIDLTKLTNAELARLEVLVNTWPDDGSMVPGGAIYAILGRG